MRYRNVGGTLYDGMKWAGEVADEQFAEKVVALLNRDDEVANNLCSGCGHPKDLHSDEYQGCYKCTGVLP